MSCHGDRHWPNTVVMTGPFTTHYGSVEIQRRGCCGETIIFTSCETCGGGRPFPTIEEAGMEMTAHLMKHLGSAPTQEGDQVEVPSPAR
jgi:hypothetical protein